MVGTVKRWLGIDALERENLILAKAIKGLQARADIAERNAKIPIVPQIALTSEPAKPKIVAKPQRTSWKQFRSVAEKATDPEREEA